MMTIEVKAITVDKAFKAITLETTFNKAIRTKLIIPSKLKWHLATIATFEQHILIAQSELLLLKTFDRPVEAVKFVKAIKAVTLEDV